MPITHLNYQPAVVKTCTEGILIEFYQEVEDQPHMKRFRRTFVLNRIKDLTHRNDLAAYKIKNINKVLKTGKPWHDRLLESMSKETKEEILRRELKDAEALVNRIKGKLTKLTGRVEDLGDTLLVEAMDIAEKLKCNTDRQRTIDVVTSMCRIFKTFLKKRGWLKLRVKDFTRRKAMAFLDYGVIERGIQARTYNNYIERMKSLMYELVQREYIAEGENPFSGIKKKKVTGKKRRAFHDVERHVVAKHIEAVDKWLFLGLQLQYHCFVRPIEMRRMRVHMIDLKEGVIRLPAEVTKNKESATITIPKMLLPYLNGFGLEGFNQRWLLFGAGGKPHPSKCCGHNTYNLRHKKILASLFKDGLLDDIEGLSYYSWKDTGAMELFKKGVNLLEIMRQLRHKELNTTQQYCHSLYVINKEIQELDNPIY